MSIELGSGPLGPRNSAGCPVVVVALGIGAVAAGGAGGAVCVSAGSVCACGVSWIGCASAGGAAIKAAVAIASGERKDFMR